MSWCAKNEDISTISSCCFSQTFLLLVPSICFFALLLWRVSHIRSLFSLDSLSERVKRDSTIMIGFSFMEAVLIIAITAEATFSIAAIISCVIGVLTWLALAYAISLEVWRESLWPGRLVRAVLLLSLIFNMTLVALEYYDSSTALTLATGFGLVGVNAFLLLFVLFRDAFVSEAQLEKETVNRIQLDFQFSNPVRRRSNSSNSWFSSGNTRGSGDVELHERSSSLLQSLVSCLSFFSSQPASFRSTRFSEDDDADSENGPSFGRPLLEQHQRANGRKDPSGDPRPSEPLVQSAIERNIRGSWERSFRLSSAAPDRNSLRISTDQCSRSTSSAGACQNQQGWKSNLMGMFSSDAAEAVPPHESQSLLGDSREGVHEAEERVISSGLGSLEDAGVAPSRAMQHLLEHHRAKVASMSPRVSPAGVGSFPIDRRKHDLELSKGSSATATPATTGPDFRLRDCVASVPRWGFRRAATPSIDQGEGAIEQAPEGGSGTGVRAGVEGEVEFEIGVVGTGRGSSDGQPAIESVSVWRTAKEISELHAKTVSLLGDFAPRRPVLNSFSIPSGESGVERISQPLSDSDLQSDLRSVAVFLNALLRVPTCWQLQPVIDFFSLPNPGAEESCSTDLSPRRKKASLNDFDSPEGSPKRHFLTTAVHQPESSPLSLMDHAAAERSALEQEQAQGQDVGRQEKWRKLFFRMRIKLKPKDIAIRCRLFEGVISGAEVAAWLTHSQAGTASAPLLQLPSPRQQTLDGAEACSIGQELLSCALLEPVCAGYQDEEEEDVRLNQIAEDQLPETPEAPAQSSPKPNSSCFSVFSDAPGHIYRFQLRSGSAGSWTLFGAAITVKIPTMMLCSDGEAEALKSSRDTMEINPQQPDPDTNTSSGGSSGQHVKYIIDISHGTDNNWQTSKRYREFEQLSKGLLREGIRPDCPLPSKSLVNRVNRLTRAVGTQMDENRRVNLENYLRSAVKAVLVVGSRQSKELLARFLDDDFRSLRIHPRHADMA